MSTYALPGPDLRSALDFVEHFTADHDDGRPLLTCVCVEFADDGIWLAASDSYALGWTWVGENGHEPPDIAADTTAMFVAPPDLLRAAIGDAETVTLAGGESPSLGVLTDRQYVAINPETRGITAGESYPSWRKLADPDYTPPNARSNDRCGLDPQRLATLGTAFDGSETVYLDADELGPDEDPVWVKPPSPIIVEPPADTSTPARIAGHGQHRWAILMPLRILQSASGGGS